MPKIGNSQTKNPISSQNLNLISNHIQFKISLEK